MTDANTSLDTLRKHLTAFNRQMGADSYINTVTGLGVPGTSKSGYTWFGRDRILQPGELQNLYLSNAYATRIVDRMVDDATRTDWTLTGVDKHFDWSSVKSEVDDLGGLLKIGDAWRWARLYGGGLVVPALIDGQHYSQPLDLSKVQGIRGLATLDSTNVMVQGFFAASGASAWSEPTGYQVMTPVADMGGAARTIHPSRVIRFDGCRVPAALQIVNGGWSPSVLQRCKTQLEAYGSILGYAREIMHDLSVMVVGLEGFNVMTMGDNGMANAREILRQLRWGIDNLNLLVIDKAASTYQEVKRSVEGLEKLILRFEADLVGASGMTRLILTGEQASGLGASSGDEVRAWYSSVQTEQKFTVSPALNRLLEIIFAIRRNRGEQVPTEWSIEWAPLTTPEPKASAEIAEIWMRTVQTGVMTGVISPDQGTDILIMNGVLKDLPGESTGEGLEGGEAEDPGDLELAALPGAVPPVDPDGPQPAASEPVADPKQASELREIIKSVSTGELAPETANWLIKVTIPVAVATPEMAAEARTAIQAAAAKYEASKAPVAVPVPLAAPAEGTPSDAEEEEEENPIDVAWSSDPLPADAMTAKEIAVAIGVKTGRVTKLVREGRLRQWNVLGKKLISLRDVRAIILEDNATTDAADRTDRSEHSLFVSIRAPRKIAQWVPFKAEDESPPHVTVLVCKDVDRRQAEALTAELQTLARDVAPFTITTGDVGYFDNDDQRVAWAGINGEGLHALHETVCNIAAALGMEISVFDGGYAPHLTLAYLPTGEEYDGASPPVGSPWAVDSIEVGYGETRTVLVLAGNASESAPVG